MKLCWRKFLFERLSYEVDKGEVEKWMDSNPEIVAAHSKAFKKVLEQSSPFCQNIGVESMFVSLLEKGVVSDIRFKGSLISQDAVSVLHKSRQEGPLCGCSWTEVIVEGEMVIHRVTRIS